MQYTNQNGRSMIEMLGVLAVIGVLTVGGFSLVGKVSTSHRANTLVDEVGALANRTRTIFHEFVVDKTSENQVDTDMNMNKYICEARAYPESLEPTLSDNSAAGSFTDKDDVKFDVVHYRSDKKIDYYYIKVSQLDKDLCMALSQSSWGSPSINGFMGICVGTCTTGTCSGCTDGGIVGTTKGTYIATNGAKMALDDSVMACSSDTDNAVFLTFR